MKKITLILLTIVGILNYAYAKTTLTKITGLIQNSVDSVSTITLTVCDRLSFEKPEVITEVETNEGKFEFSFNISRITYIYLAVNGKRILYKPAIYSILVEVGDSIHLEIPDLNRLGLYDIDFSGKGAEKTEFVKRIFVPILATFKGIKPYAKQSIEEKFFHVTKIRAAVDSVVRTNEEMVGSKIASIIKARCLYLTYDGIFTALSRLDLNDEKIKTLFYDKIVQTDAIKIFYENEVIYNLHANYVLNCYPLLLDAFEKGVSLEANSIRFAEPLKFYSIISKFYSSYPVTRNFLLSAFVFTCIREGEGWKHLKSLTDRYFADFEKKELFYPQVLNTLNKAKINLTKGTAFFDFSLEDATGKFVKVSDLKGNVIVLDFYFTGCSGCKQMIPFMQDVEKHFEAKAVKFVSISVDKDKAIWAKGRGIYSSPNSIQLYTNGEGYNHDLISYAQIDSYPRLILIDKDGKIITGKAPDPRVEKEKLIAVINHALSQ